MKSDCIDIRAAYFKNIFSIVCIQVSDKRREILHRNNILISRNLKFRTYHKMQKARTVDDSRITAEYSLGLLMELM